MTFREIVISGVAITAIGVAIYAFGREVEAKGHGANYGDNPNYVAGQEVKPKNPLNYFTVVYLGMEPSGKLSVRHSIFNATGKDKAWVDAEVQKLINRRFPNSDWNTPDNGANGPQPVQRPDGSYNALNDFDNFYFGKPMRIYVYSAIPAVTFDQTWPVMFTEFSAKDRSVASDQQWKGLDKNKTIHNVRPIEIAQSGSLPTIPKTRLIYLENHFKDKQGNPENPNYSPSNPARKFVDLSINFNIWWETAAGGKIPTVFDPDTGNGVGSPPPP